MVSSGIPSVDAVRELLGLRPLTASSNYNEAMWVRDKNGQWVAYTGLSMEEMWVTDPATGQEVPQFAYGDIYSSNIDTTPDYKARVSSPTLEDGTVVFEVGNSVNYLGKTEPPPDSEYDSLPTELPIELEGEETAFVRQNPDTFELDSEEEQARASLDTGEEQPPPPPPAPVEDVEQPPPPPDDFDYRMGHRPDEDGPPLHNLTTEDGEWSLPEDVYTHPERYGLTDISPRNRQEVASLLRDARGNPDRPVTMYRAAPESFEGVLHPGDWVTPAREYAEIHAKQWPGMKVISATVPASSVRNAGDSLLEWGYWGESVEVDEQPPPPPSVEQPPPPPMDITYRKVGNKTYVVVDGKMVGTVRPPMPLETMNRAGRGWIGADRSGTKRTGVYPTRQEAAEAIAARYYRINKPRPLPPSTGEEEQPPPPPAARKRAPAKKAPAKKATPSKRAPAKKTAAKRTTKKAAAAPVGPNIGRFRNIRDQETAAKAAAAQAAQVERQHQLALASLKLAQDNLAKAQSNRHAEPHLKEEAQAAVGRAAAVKRAADKVRRDAKASQAAAEGAGSLDEALTHALATRDLWMESQNVAADAKQIERDVLTSAKAEPRPGFKNAAAKQVFLNPPETHRRATPQEERSVLGNAKEWAGLWVAKNDDDYRPLIKVRPTGALRAMYSPEHHLAAERRKWAKVELVRQVAPALAAKLNATANGQGITGTPREQRATLDNAAAARLVMQTGMRAGNPGNQSTIKNAQGREETISTYGATTLRAEHVESGVNRRADGTPTSMYLKFYGKSGVLNRIKVTDPETIEDILRRKEAALERKRSQTAKQRRENPDDELFPNATASAAGEMVNQYAQEALAEAGIAAEVAENFGPSDDEEDPMSDATFSLRTLRTLHANAITAEILSKMIARRKPKNREEWIEYMEQATEKAAAILGNQHTTFKLNYLSALPFLQWMPEGEGENGEPAWEDWWVWGKKNLDKPS